MPTAHRRSMTSIVCARCQAGRHLVARTGFEANGVVKETHTFAEGPRVRIPVPPAGSLLLNLTSSLAPVPARHRSASAVTPMEERSKGLDCDMLALAKA